VITLQPGYPPPWKALFAAGSNLHAPFLPAS